MSEITEKDIQEYIQKTQKDFKRNATILAVLFLVFGVTTFLVISNMPVFTQEEKKIIFRIPRSGKQLSELSQVIKAYSETYNYEVLAGFCCLYIFLQTFAIPGAIFLSIIAGTLFGPYFGFSLVWLCATSGAVLCYSLSWTFGKALIVRLIPHKIIWFSKKLKEQEGNLFWYLLFLRITPFLPNWFINISSPVLEVPLIYFATATLFGLMPLNIIHIRTGLMLNEVTQVGGFDFWQILYWIGLGCLALIPTMFKSKLQNMFENEENTNSKLNKKNN